MTPTTTGQNAPAERPRLAGQAADRLDNAEAVIIDGAGHMTHVDKPEQWMTALESFLTLSMT